jgi:energy-coupling factor transport system permease protein
MKNDPFSALHPAVHLLYFALVGTFSLWLGHPACLAVSLGAACACAVCLRGGRAAAPALLALAALAAVTALLNPLFSHQGVTILAYLPSGNPLTKESLLYGLCAGAALSAVLGWFFCLNAVLTSEELTFLFGRVSPALALLVSMTLRFVPRFLRQMRQTARARRGARGEADGPADPGEAAGVLSGVTGWALESAIETAESMRSRGYGLPGRSAYAPYRFGRRDRRAALALAACGAFLAGCRWSGALAWRCYPSVRGSTGPLLWCACGCYAALCLLPVILKSWEAGKWRAWNSGR